MRLEERLMNKKDPSETTSNAGQGSSEGRLIYILRGVSIIALVVGATGSLIFMFRAGQQTPGLLLVLFTLWVLAPFAALFWATIVSKRWSVATRWTLYCMTLIISPSSLVVYSEWLDLKPAGSANAFLWVIVPPISLVFSTIVVLITALISRGLSRRGR